MSEEIHSTGNCAPGARWLVRAAVAAAISGSLAVSAIGAESTASPGEELTELEEVQVTGSRIVRRDTQSNSPLVTIERERLDDNAYISIEQALNELPEFMAGGAGMSAGAVTGLTAAGDVAGGNGTGNMFDVGRLPDNARIGTFVPGNATINLRGLGPNRSLTLIDGHRGVPSTAAGVLDLNTIPQSALQSIEVISGGASAVYGADALAGVTNFKFRDSFEGISVRVRGGVNEHGGDGEEYQMSTLLGTRLADGRGNAMIGVEYNKRNVSLFANRGFLREAMESEYSGAANYIFLYHPHYGPGSACTPGVGGDCTTTSNAVNAGGGFFANGQWGGNAPTQDAVNSVFFDRTCGGLNCIGTTGVLGSGFGINTDGTLFTRSSVSGTGPAAIQWGPQSFTGPLGGTAENPDEVTCAFFANTTVGAGTPFAGESCMPTLNRVDYGRWLSSPRESYAMFGRANYEITDGLRAFTNVNFTSSQTNTRREPAPALGAWSVAIPFHSDPDARYLPSIAQFSRPGVNVGDTLPEYRVGGARGTNCDDVGGCTMQEAFPVPEELAILLASRPNVVRGGDADPATNPWGGLSVCELRTRDFNAGLPGHTVQVPASGGNPAHTVQIDPNTGDTLKICGPNSAWRLAQTTALIPSRGTTVDQRVWQIAAGLQGDLGVSDWTWEAYMSHGDSRAYTNFDGFMSLTNYIKFASAPNYGQGFLEEGTGGKVLRCTSGINPFDPTLQISQDCLDGISSNQVDRNLLTQRVYELNAQGHLMDLPAGEVRAAVGVGRRNIRYSYLPDSQRERDYIPDTTPAGFGVTPFAAGVSVKEVYGELLVPLLRDLPFVNRLELELGGRLSDYSTGQEVPTWKALASWEPVSWLRARGGYNRAERAPNIAELYSPPSSSSQLTGFPTDPCRTDVSGPAFAATFPPGTTNADPDDPSGNGPTPEYRAMLQALCGAQIDAWGGNGASEFHALMSTNGTFNAIAGGTQLVGNENLKSEKGQTWTLGLVLTSPFDHPLLRRGTMTVDWYEVRIDNPIEPQTAQSVVNACFNVDGSNPDFDLDDPGGFCSLIERNPVSGAIQRISAQYDNYGKTIIRGVDVALRWSASLVDMGFGDAPGTISVNLAANLLADQIQALTAGGATADYAGYTGASPLRASTGVTYSWGVANRVGLTWNYRQGTRSFQNVAATATTPATITRSTTLAGYPTNNLFNLTAGTRLGPVNASFTIQNLLDSKPGRAAYDFRDPTQGLGSFDPFADLVGRRYSMNLSVEF